MKKRKSTYPTQCEILEVRQVPSSISVLGTVLVIAGDSQSNDIRVESADPIQVNIDGNITLYTGIDGLLISGLGGDDYIVNATAIDATIRGGNGDDYLQGGTGDDALSGENGNDILTDFTNGGGSNLLDGGNGDDNLWGGPGPTDSLVGGSGDDVLYDIVGGPNQLNPGRGDDIVISRATDTVLAADGDVVVSFGSVAGPVALNDGILYLLGGGGNDQFTVTETQSSVLVDYTVAGVVLQFSFRKSDVRMIAGVGGAGDDVFDNQSSVDSVFYGTGGNDTLIGGTGFDIIKGGSGNDLLVGGAGDDLSGDSAADVIISSQHHAGNPATLRTDATDLVFAQPGDFVITN